MLFRSSGRNAFPSFLRQLGFDDLQDFGRVGLGLRAKRATTSPLRPMTNFSKFQVILPDPLGLASKAVRYCRDRRPRRR